MNIRKKQSNSTVFGDVPGWRIPLKKYQDINSPLVINQIYTVRGFADINRSPRYTGEVEEEYKKLPDVKRKSKSLQEKKLKPIETENNGEKCIGSKISEKEKTFKNSVSSHTKRNQEYRIKYDSVFDEEDKRILKVKNKLKDSGKLKTVRGNPQKIKVVGEVNNFERCKGTQFMSSNQEELHSKKKNRASPEVSKNTCSNFPDFHVDSESKDKKLPILFSLETNSCFSKDLNAVSTKVLKVDAQHSKVIEPSKSQQLIPNFNLAVNKPDPIKLPSTKPYINLADISEANFKPSELEQAKSHRSLSKSKLSQEKDLKEQKPKNPITPSTNKSDSQKCAEMQLSIIKEETFSQLALKNSVSRKTFKSKSTKEINCIKKTPGLESTKQTAEKNMGLDNFELKPFSRDASPEDLITQLKNPKRDKSADLSENNLILDCENAQKNPTENVDKRKSVLNKRLKKTTGKRKLTQKIIKQHLNIEFPNVNHVGTLTENFDKNEFTKEKKGAERFIENFSISIFSYISLILVEFKGNLGLIHEKIEESYEQRKIGIENTELISLYKNKIKEKMISELYTVLEPFKKPSNSNTPDSLAASIFSRNFSEGIKNDLIFYITSRIYLKKFSSLKKSLKKLIENRLDYTSKIKFHSDESVSSDSHYEKNFKQFSKSSKNLKNKEIKYNHIEDDYKSEICEFQQYSNLKSDKEFEFDNVNYLKNIPKSEDIHKSHKNRFRSTQSVNSESLLPIQAEYVDVENLKSSLKKQRFLKDNILSESPGYQAACPKLLIIESEDQNPLKTDYEQTKKTQKHYKRPEYLENNQKSFNKREEKRSFSNKLKIISDD